MKIEPIFDRLIVRRADSETEVGGVVLPEAYQEKSQMGVVVACGEYTLNDDGTKVPLEVKVGDTIIFPKHCGTDIVIDGESFLVMVEAEVFGVVEDANS